MNLSKALLSLAATTARIAPMPVKRLVYRFKPLAGMIRSTLNHAAPHGETVVEIASGALIGWRMALDLHSEKDYWLGTYEPDLQAALTALVIPGMIAYDVGANIGYISLQLARHIGDVGRVFAFEALPENLRRLQQNLELNEIVRRVEIVPAAVLDADQPVRFLPGPSGGMGKVEGSAGRQEVSHAPAISVAGVSLDGFVYSTGKPAPALVKMDIEGGEALALPGMRRLLAEACPLLLIELHGPEATQVAWDILTAADYRICRMAAGFPPVTASDELGWKAYIAAFPPLRAHG